MRIIDADELMEHVWRDKLDSRELIAKMIDNAPTVKEISTNIPIDVFEKLISQEPKSEWIPLKTRPMTEEERTYYRDWTEYGAEMFDCPLPDDGQEVLISCSGYVCTDIFVRDDNDGCYFEGVDIDDVDAWMPLPKSYDGKY
jgi:hypothetical protein